MDNPEKEILNNLFSPEDQNIPVIENKEPEIATDLKPYIEKLEQEIYLTKPITDDGGQPLISNAAPVDPVITLPLTQQTYAMGMKKKVSDSARWLAEWCLRLVKILGNRAVFREVKEEAVVSG